jgi:hypothetical protein
VARSESARCQAVDARVELGAIDGVTVADQTHDLSVGTQGLDDLLRCPCGARMRRHINVEQSAAFKREDEKSKTDANRYSMRSSSFGLRKAGGTLFATGWGTGLATTVR